MIDVEMIERISGEIHDFAEGNPKHFEERVVEGVTFDFDCTFSEDLMEPEIPVAVVIEQWSPYNHGEPERDTLMEYSEEMDELTCDLDDAFYNGGSRNEDLTFIYSEINSDPENDFYIFLENIHNPRMEVTTHGTEVQEEYA